MIVHKRNSWNTGGVELMLIRETRFPNGKRSLAYAKPVELEWVTLEDECSVLPEQGTLHIGYEDWIQFVPSMNEVLNHSGIPLDSEKAAQSELKATKYHLEDLRELIFKKNPA